MKDIERHKGFTLAETLITLVIIGVVAALTVPNMLQQYKRQDTSAKLKKFYSTIQQASIKAKSDENSWDDWAAGADLSNAADSSEVEYFQNKYLLPYISYYKKNISGKYVYIYLNDGTYFYNAKGTCIDFRFDANGAKKPNQFGKDQFIFLYCPSGTTYWIKPKAVIPYQRAIITTREQALEICKSEASSCSALLMFDGWEFKDDYPYRL